jgi:hypothetical protein
VLIDRKLPNVIAGTKIETAGATFAAYRVMSAQRGYRTESLALLIGPDGTVQQQINNRPYRPTIRSLASLMGAKVETPKWENELLESYALPAGENLLRMAPPYSQAREYYRFFNHGRIQATMTFEQGETLRPSWATFSSDVTLEFVLGHVLGIKSYELIDPDNVLKRKITGDWCVRAGTPREKLLHALEQILHHELNWKVRFERTTVRQNVVIAAGKWKQSPLPGAKNQSDIYLTVDDVPDPNYGGGSSGSLDAMFAYVGDRIQTKFVSEVLFPPAASFTWQDRIAEHMNEIRNQTPAGKELLERLLQSLARQTGLVLQVVDRDVDVWRVIAE